MLNLAGAGARAAIVDAGQHVLAPNAQGQQIAILVTGGDAVAGVDLFVQVGDGGPVAGGDDAGPTITAVDLFTDAIFAANNSGAFTDPTPLLWGATTTTLAGTVVALGRLATLTIDTTGLTTGRFDLILNPTATGPTQLVGAATTLMNGWLQIGAPPSPDADFDADGSIDAADLVNWRTGFGMAAHATQSQGDANADGSVDGADFIAWQQQLGVPAPAAAIPEPASCGMASIFLAFMLFLCRASGPDF